MAFWPFDGLSLDDSAYSGRHICVEIYPSGVRPSQVPQSDRADTISSAFWLRKQDEAGVLAPVLDLSSRSHAAAEIALEGWIAGAGAQAVRSAAVLTPREIGRLQARL
jgi:hypothetical protein